MDVEKALYPIDMFGDPIKPEASGPVAEKFLIPPFSILDAKKGEWQDRKRAWVSIGLESENGRKASGSCSWNDLSLNPRTAESTKKIAKVGDGPTLFDPVLCELIYRWFCPQGGQVVDPFAGGSVRGIIARILGLKYWGCDLRQEQIDANNKQAQKILPEKPTVDVEISGKMLQQKFHGCDEVYIRKTCQGRCCEGQDGISVIAHSSEVDKIEALGAKVKDGFIVADGRGLCPFKGDDGLCIQHENKPLGCKSSPFTFTNSGLLIIRNRYRCLRCYKTEDSTPAYIAHRWSLAQIFGESEAARICEIAKKQEGNIIGHMPIKNARILCDNHNSRNDGNLTFDNTGVKWVCGDSTTELTRAPDADLIFSCPPYGDLEKYSDDPKDLSAMDFHAFLAAYKRIILQSVRRLKENRFACFVVGDFRDNHGFYRNFVSETIAGFEAAGARLYNEAILATSVGSASMRVTRQFNGGRKLCKTHQNVLVFCKGDWKKATASISQ